MQKRAPLYDKAQEEHYNLISALHKSVRGSDPDAALYWLARMLAGGEEPLYIARRLVRMAVEDIGLADPQALHAGARRQGHLRISRPARRRAGPGAGRDLSRAPRPNRTPPTRRSARRRRAAEETGSLTPPTHILNAPTGLMKELGYGAGYEYDHDAEEALLRPELFPRGMARRASTARPSAGSSARSQAPGAVGEAARQETHAVTSRADQETAIRRFYDSIV